MRSRVAVVGGGLAGLAVARRLVARGDLDVQVWEAGSRVGGVLVTSREDGFVREHAANGALTAAPDGAMALAEDLGLPVEPASASARRRWIVRDGALHRIPGDLVGLVGWRAIGDALLEPLRATRQDGADETVAGFARRRLGAAVADRIVAPLCTGVYAGDPEQLSVRAAFPRLAELEAEGGLLRGGVSHALRRVLRGEGSRPRSRIAAPKGGMAVLVDALARELGDRVQLDAPVIAIEANGRGRALRLADGRREPYDAVVLAVPAPVAARLLSDAGRELSDTLAAIPYAPVAVVHLGYRRSDIPHPMDGFGFLVAPGEQLRVLGAVFESVLWPDRAPPGHVLVRCMLGGARDPAALELDDAGMVERSHQDLTRVLGIHGAPSHRHVARWSRAIPQYTVGHQARVARAEALVEPLGVVLAGAGYRGVSVNACAADAARVVHQVAARLGLSLALTFAAACSSGAKSGVTAAPPGDAGGERRVAGASGSLPPAGGSGSVEVVVEWLDPPAPLLVSPGRNRCGAAVRPVLAVNALGGVSGAVVRLEASASPASAGDGPPVELAVRDCQVASRSLSLARPGPLLLVNDDERRHEVTLEWIAMAKGAEPTRLATVPLALVGATVAVPLERAGLHRASAAADPATASWVLVPEHGNVALTDDSGRVRFDPVPVGRHAVSVWYPPVDRNGGPIIRHGEVTVADGSAASLTISLAPAR